MGKPLWRRAYDVVERPVGARLEAAVQTELFADAAGLLVRTQAQAGRLVERTTRRALHRVNLPAASDVARLREQIAAMDRNVRRLERALQAKDRQPTKVDEPDEDRRAPRGSTSRERR